MEYKVSYRSEWNKEGTHYNQRITIPMTALELCLLNDDINIEFMRLKEQRDLKAIYFKPLFHGKNYITLSLRDYIVKKYLNPNDKRIKDRNTMIVIK